MNLINQISFEPSVSSSLLERQTSERLGKTLNEVIVPTLDKCFSNFSFTEEDIRIDQLKIDLGQIPIQELHKVLPKRLEEELESLLYLSNKGDTNTLAEQIKSKRELEKRKVSTLSNSRLEALLFFLREGQLPWWYSENETLFDTEKWKPETIQELQISLKELLEKNQYTALTRFYRHLLITKSEFATFLTDKVSDTEVHWHVTPSLTNETLHAFFTWLISPQLIKTTNSNLESLAKGLTLLHKQITGKQVELTLTPSIQKTNPDSSLTKKKDKSEALTSLGEQGAKTKPTPAIATLEDLSAEKSKVELPAKKTKENSHPSASLTNKNALNPAYTHETTLPPQSAPTSFTEEQNHLEWPLSNAGLVLLHPFIPTLFKKLDFMDGKMIKPECLSIALQTLQYLCRGKAGLPEYTLLLEKTFCGIPHHQLIDFPPLTKEIMDETEKLLEAVITHWGALKKTSPRGLRGSFLIRDGILKDTPNGWQIQVERQAYDILLERLPWPIGLIKFPWIKHPIHVLWNN